jgi:hypothetical protein
MARDINKRIENLKTRRAGTDRLERLAADSQIEVLAKSLLTESWQSRAKDSPNTRYALGAMQEVDPDYTRISVETAQKVGRNLEAGLSKVGISVDLRLQGSVPLNVHIRGVSDVDLLSINNGFLTYATAGVRSKNGHYTSPSARTSLDVLTNLRIESEKVLKAAYSVAKVDTSGSKAIKLSGGSLPRPVDVVPSHWFDSIEYQRSSEESDRGVTILDKSVPATLDNFPFLHIKRIKEGCALTLGGLRKSIRLCKNVKADAEREGTRIALPSFDIAAIMYHADVSGLIAGYSNELAILAETQRHLDALATNHAHAKTLMVPDGSRRIFDAAEKLVGLNLLSLEMDDLTRQVAKEQDWRLSGDAEPSLAQSRKSLLAASAIA